MIENYKNYATLSCLNTEDSHYKKHRNIKKKANIAFLIDDLCSLCGLTRNLLENLKWMDKDRFNLFIYVLDGSKILKEFKRLRGIIIKDIRFYKFNPLSYIRIINLLKSDNIKIIHSYPFVSNLIGPFLAKVAGVRKIITSVHSETIIRSRFLSRLSYSLSDRIIVVSKYLREFLKESRVILDTNKIMTLYNGVDLELYRPGNGGFVDRKKIGISRNDLVIMTVSKLRWERGHEYIVKALEKIKKNKNSFKFVFVGDGPLESKIKSMAKDLGVEEKILFMGYKDNIYELLPLCDIFLLPSISEGVGMIALLEAMAMEKPIITTAIGSIPEVVRDGENGLLVKSADPDAILDALYRLANDKLLRQIMGVKGRQIAEKNFDARNKVKELERVYLNI